MKLYLRLVLFLLLPFLSFGQEVEKNRSRVLKKGIVNKTFTYGKWTENGGDELQLTYLGTIKSKKTTYKIMNSIWYWGSGRATSRILIFDIKNKYLGEYFLTMDYEVPKRIKNNCLLFQSDCEENSQKKITSISFDKGIPKHLVVNYNNTTALISTFDKAD